MQFILATAALVATAAASSLEQRDTEFNVMSSFKASKAGAKIVNRCPYTVYVWSVLKGMNCPPGAGAVLRPGEHYQENYRTDAVTGVSIKISKTESCKSNALTQLEYFIDKSMDGNFLDMSFVNCLPGHEEDCPGRTDGFYLKSGNEDGRFKSAVNNEHCPVFSVHNAKQAAEVSYINWDDRQTKFCNKDADMDLYLCGGDAPDASPAPAPAPAAAVNAPVAPVPTPSSDTPSAAAPATSSAEKDNFVVAAAAPVVTSAPTSDPPPVIKTEVVFVTEWVNEKRHAHGRRHQHFRS